MASTPYTFCTIQPTFTILDRAAAEPIMAEFVEATKREAGCIYYGWSIAGDKLFCREAYVDGAAVNAHLENVGALIGKLLADGVCTLDNIAIHGPADQLELVKPGTKDLGTVYFGVHSGFTNLRAATGPDAAPQTLMTVQPTFTILDRAVAEPIMAEFVEATKREDGCVYYGWTVAGDKLFCREAYVDGAAVNAHLENVGALIGRLLADGVCTLDKIAIHGPADQLELVKPGTKDLGTVYFGVHSGFSRYQTR